MKRTILAARNPQYVDPDHTVINIEVGFREILGPDGRPQWLPFTARENDSEEHGRKLWQNARNGVYGPIAPYTPHEPSE